MIEIDDPLVANLEAWVDQLNLEYNAIEDRAKAAVRAAGLRRRELRKALTQAKKTLMTLKAGQPQLPDMDGIPDHPTLDEADLFGDTPLDRLVPRE